MRRLVSVGLLALGLSACGIEGVISFLHDPPDLERIPGTYVLDPAKYSYASLGGQGYRDLSASLALKSDGSFTVTRLPDCCVYGQVGYFGGYFDGEGTWSVAPNAAVFDVQLRFTNIRREGSTSIGQPQRRGEGVSLTLTKGRPNYGLAAPLFDGEFQYAYFHKKG